MIVRCSEDESPVDAIIKWAGRRTLFAIADWSKEAYSEYYICFGVYQTKSHGDEDKLMKCACPK